MATKRLPAAWLLALALALPAQAAEFNQVVTGKSHIGFVFTQMGVPVSGDFSTFAAQVSFDPAKPDAARAKVEIDLASVDAGGQEAGDEVKSKNWFYIQLFPTATFVSSSVKSLGASRYQLAGRLTIKGKTHDIVVPIAFKPDGANGLLEGSFTLKRLDYDIGRGPWGDTDTVADEVQVTFRFLVAAAPATK
jgi:polyisoprenoid-binding protein YceI